MTKQLFGKFRKPAVALLFAFGGLSQAIADEYIPSDTVSINFKINRFVDFELEGNKFKKGKEKHVKLKDMLNKSKFLKKIKRLHSATSYKQFKEERKSYKEKGIMLPKLANWYTIPTKKLTANEIADVMFELKQMPFIETIEIMTPVISTQSVQCPNYSDCDPQTQPGGDGVGSNTPDLTGYQEYLGQAPLGIDANYAWTFQGGNGSGVKIIDMEQGYNQNHEDLPYPFIRKNDVNDNAHGTAVMSIISAKNNGIGLTGVAYGSQVGFYGWGSDTANSIKRAADNLSEGDVLILEGQISRAVQSGDTCTSTDNSECVPMEWKQSHYDQIKYATSKGINVIEAAGNGNENLDNSIYGGKFNRDVRDSGAFLIAATNPTSSISRSPFSNHGSRIDFNGWGNEVASAGGYGTHLFDGGQNRIYGDGFAGTSSASPIVAGAVASIVGYAKSQTGKTLSLAEVRDVLSDNGTQPPTGVNVGVRPDLRAAIDNINEPVLPAETVLNSSWWGCQGENSLSWGAISNATTYKVYISTLSTPPSFPAYTQSTTQKHVNRSSDSYAWVKACSSNGCSDYSNRVFLRYENYCL